MDNSDNKNQKLDVEFVRNQASHDGIGAYQGMNSENSQRAGFNQDNAFSERTSGTGSASFPPPVPPFVPPVSPAGKSGKKKMKPGVKVAVIAGIIIVAAIVLIVIFTTSGDTNRGVIGGVDEEYIGIMYIEGSIMSSADAGSSETYQHDWLLENIDSMINDENNEGILLYVDSPGGTSYESDEMYRKLMEYKDSTGRPIYAYFASQAASGAYYISSAADTITADRNTLTGSIGVYMGPVIDASELLAKLGVKADIIKSSANKAIGSGYEPVTDEQKAIYQSIIDDIYERFLGIVKESRGYTDEEARKIADGRPYTAAQALENGLIDKICTYDEALEAMMSDEGLENCETYDIRYTPEESFYGDLLGIGMKLEEIADSDKSEAQQALELIEEASDVEAYCMMR